MFSFARLIALAVLLAAMLRLYLFLARTSIKIAHCYFALVTLAVGDVMRLLLIAVPD